MKFEMCDGTSLFLQGLSVTTCRHVLELKEMVRNLQSDVEHVHFLLTRGDRAVSADGGSDERVHRLTQYVPCETEHDLRVLERKLLDQEFSRRSVSCYVDCVLP